ncbi:elongation of very long chain fatty acids protein AAEL008004 isoform X1 [Frankliniella occidentalis]|uniref:Elongation of very long chain fatty acids protein n=1 Tax=Frankliniella occidentalis TaxID=133901 RepID=A0A6J1SRS0_FRAOC|nr:elongation of very long chain fatty acids protein AAEL008004 isoform X1 [Frankliniella occidentalis]XP_026281180.1 elongation of very long chain fatty acids protein AAEL008004 isoform X1 [Frankliniella occidentalis]XP_026281181.1 elongation of very long chain fatty acids protein AAEL008004 isoform X1 [Frankliniella occidentalis]XP_052129755.1 elongation of very long chain fatty acids protein AAEL008004 isoform X1 [Frankliniella occidentalis]XP_052129756.1 elongation of very long chain fatty 
MALLVNAWNGFHEVFDRYADKRSTNWFLMGSPFYTAAICLTYVYIVKVLGPRIMENRKPFSLRNTLIVYNLFQVLFSCWLFYEIGISGWFTGEYNIRCQPVDYSDSPSATRMVHASWWYYISKFTEFFDTFFFILRKKFNNVSTLHVIHHGIMPFSVWFGVKFTPGGHSTFFGLLNTFVHIVMYTYYLLAAFGPSIQKYLWWKKYITVLQMAQFVAIMVHAFQLLFIDCNYPRAFVWWIGMHAVMFWFLFKEFYDQSYRKPKELAKAKAEAAKVAAAAAAAAAANGGDHKTTNGSLKNGAANGATGKQRAADYYINGDLASDVHYRHAANGGANGKATANGSA